jgi:hypothetical protein
VLGHPAHISATARTPEAHASRSPRRRPANANPQKSAAPAKYHNPTPGSRQDGPAGGAPEQNVFTEIVAVVVPFVSVTELGRMLQVMLGGPEMLHVRFTTPVKPLFDPIVSGKLAPCPGTTVAVVPVPGSGTKLNVLPLLLLNVAVTEWFVFMVTLQAPVPEQSMLHPPKLELFPAISESITTVPLGKLAEQVSGQLIPAGLLVTEPVPLPARVTMRTGPED